ncbi:hypothetical protein BOQ54_05915 [Chelatococcus daeguensis]|uniref:Uncharacterized protein n=1 Tax=Chelatococcus daeguensis TaxID=444444 RepID=A0AAC9NY11_9HYPH|nr:hypothetical protein [Chelatococcus daeguensis]APF36922.1 hypothetical protein BOQ54_05915 [Chelatococcus daeguensis]
MTTMTKTTRATMLALALATGAAGMFTLTAASPTLAQSAGGGQGGGGGGGAGGLGSSGEGGNDHEIYRRILARDRLTRASSSNCQPGAACNRRVPPRRPPQLQAASADDSCGMPLRVVYDRNGHALWYACQPLPQR